MKEEALNEILNLCLDIDSKAVTIYSHFARHSRKPALKTFWSQFSAQEEKHTTYWRKLIQLAKDDMLPRLFEQPYKIKSELERIRHKVDGVFEESARVRGTATMFLLAFRLEFYILHPALISFLNFLETMPNQESAIAEYRSHLGLFISALNEHGLTRPELKLLGEALDRLWKDNTNLAVMSSTDSLTGIYNRRGMFDAIIPLIYLAQRKKLPVGVMIVDIDHFKKVNDKHGHQQGDTVLVSVAGLLKSHLRISDVIGRYGGEEFLIYLSDVDTAFISEIAEKLRRLVESETRSHIPITISIGGSGGKIGKDIEEDLRELIRRADDNLYQAKAAGKNRVVVSA